MKANLFKSNPLKSNLFKLLAFALCCLGLLPAAHAQSMEQLLNQAIEQSPEVAKAKAGLQAALADLKINKAAWLPQANARLYNGVGNTTQSNPLVNQSNGSENIQNNSISIQQNLYNKPASVQIEQSELALQEAELRYASAVQAAIQNWMTTLMDTKRAAVALALATQQIETALLKKNQTEYSLKNGESSALELARTLADLAIAQAEHGELKHAFTQKLWELSRLSGKTIGANLIDTLEFTKPNTLINEGNLEQQLLEHNLNLKIQKLYTDIAELEIGKAKGQHHPTVKLLAQNTQSKSETASTLGNRVKQNVLAVQMDIPLFNGFASQGQTEKAAASLSKQHADYDNMKNQALRDAWAANRQLAGAADLLNAYGHAVQSATQEQKAVETAIEHQLATPLDMAQAKAKLAELRLKQIDYLLTANKAHLKILELTGGLNVEKAAGRLVAGGR